MVSLPYKRDPHHSHIFRDSCGSGVGIVWVKGPIIGDPWKSRWNFVKPVKPIGSTYTWMSRDGSDQDQWWSDQWVSSPTYEYGILGVLNRHLWFCLSSCSQSSLVIVVRQPSSTSSLLVASHRWCLMPWTHWTNMLKRMVLVQNSHRKSSCNGGLAMKLLLRRTPMIHRRSSGESWRSRRKGTF